MALTENHSSKHFKKLGGTKQGKRFLWEQLEDCVKKAVQIIIKVINNKEETCFQQNCWALMCFILVTTLVLLVNNNLHFLLYTKYFVIMQANVTSELLL